MRAAGWILIAALAAGTARAGAPADSVTPASSLELGMAAYVGDLGAVRALLKRGVDVDQTDQDLQTPLMNALSPYLGEAAPSGGAGPRAAAEESRRQRKFQIVQLLLRHGASVTRQNSRGVTPLHLAVSTTGTDAQVRALVSELLRRGAAVDAPTKARVTPLLMALHARRPALARLLVENGARLDVKSEDGETPESLATKNGMPDLVKFIAARRGRAIAAPRVPAR